MAMRVVTGLPKCTKIEELETIAGMNCLRDIAQEDKISQVLRLQKTTAGRNILMKLDIECPDTPISIPPPPWEDETVVDTKPLPQNLSKEQMGRRKTAAKKHNYDLQNYLKTLRQIYTIQMHQKYNPKSPSQHTDSGTNSRSQEL